MVKYLFILVFLFSVDAFCQLKATPIAEGHGRFTTGGRGYGVFFVSNLNNTGAGSLKQALADANSAGGGNIIFRTGGTITITGNLDILSNNISIWGMSASGDGIAVYGDNTVLTGQNIIITDMRFRAGDPNDLANDDAFRIGATNNATLLQNYMIDHCSFSWSDDENISIASPIDGSGGVNNVTLQNSIISESFDGRTMLLYGDNITNVSIIKNYIANTQQRNIRASVAGNVSWEQINNFIYNYGIGVNPSNKHKVDVVGNVFQEGPSGSQLVSTIDFSVCSASNCPPSGDSDFTGTALHYTDNTFNGGAISVSSNATPYISGTRVVNSGYAPISSSLVKDYIANNVGARATMEGVDALDAHVIQDGINGNTGSWPSTEAQTTGLPALSLGTPYTDTDNDGIEDFFEIANFGNLNQTHLTDFDGDGYTDLEEFMHSRAGMVAEVVTPVLSGELINRNILYILNN
jgi:hypothetical protein